MNHISKSFAVSDGRVYKSHSWELREGGYRRIALLLGNGLWPTAKETRLIAFLLDHGFRVLALDLAFGSTLPPRTGLRAYRDAVAAFAQASVDPDLPFYLLASSFSAGAVIPIAGSIPALAALALLAPVVDFPPPRLKKSCFLNPCAELVIRPADLCGESGLAAALVTGGLMPESAALRFRKRDLWTAATDLAASLAEGLPVPVAAFSGEDDAFITQEGRAALSRSGAKLYAFPRVKHEPGRDRYADNYYADLGSFLDEVESTGVKKRN
jgi:alpha-beta hydrolase superfamily lysophospholipase